MLAWTQITSTWFGIVGTQEHLQTQQTSRAKNIMNDMHQKDMTTELVQSFFL
jgi:hypothetical protein